MQGNDRLPETIGGYRIVRRLAREATVDVLLARTREEGTRGDERNVVLKLVSPTFLGDPSFEQTFARETQALAQLDHPNVVRLCDVFSGTDIKAMVLEHVDGLSLAELKAALAKRTETLPDAASYAIAGALFSALAAAHAARDPQSGNLLPIVHRDIHPAQIQIGRDGSVKLGGFGIERITGVRGDARSAGARGYLPPEKARGEAVTIRSDVYAATLVIWELLARRRAVRDDALPEQELLRALSQPSLVSLDVLRPDLPALVRSVVARALEPQIERRAVTAEEVASIFRSAASPEEGRRLLVLAVAHALGRTLSPEPLRAAKSGMPGPIPRTGMPSNPELTPSSASAPVSVSERPGPPRPSPRRMWGSSPTFTPSAPVVAPISSSRGSIPDARLSQSPHRPETSATIESKSDPPAAPLPPQSDRTARAPVSNRTAIGGFSVASLKPLLEAPPAPASRPPPRPESTRPEPTRPEPTRPEPTRPEAARAVPTPQPLFATPNPPPARPGDPLPGMAVPLATGATILEDMAPLPPPVVDAPLPPPPPPADGAAPFWSMPPTAPTIRYGRKRKRSSLTALGIGLFFVAMAVGAAGFVWLFRRSAAHNAQITTAPPASVRPPASAPVPVPVPVPVPASPSPSPSPSASASASASAQVVTPTPTPTASTPPAPAPVAAADPNANTGAIRFEKHAAGHRVFIDGRVVGEGEGPYTVPCGAHTVRVGSKGRSQKIDVPCGGEVTATMK